MEAIVQVTELCYPILSLTPDDLHHQVQQSILTITGEQVAYEFLTTIPGVPLKAPIMYVSDAVERTLWHNRTGHTSFERLKKLSHMSTGMGTFKLPEDIEKCRTCMIAKMRKMARGGPEDISPTEPGQILACDFGFMYQQSKNKARAKRLAGIFGHSAYLILYDLYTDIILGVTTSGKKTPTEWLNCVFSRIKSKNPRRYIRMDGGGELSQSPEFKKILKKHDYIPQQTGANASSSNGKAERPHQDAAQACKALLTGAGLPLFYWPFAFYYWVFRHSILPHGDSTETPYEKVTGKKPNLSKLRTFGSRIHAYHPNKKDGKLSITDAVPGKFLGFCGSFKLFY